MEERSGCVDAAVDGVVVGDGQAVRHDEKAAGVGRGRPGVDLLLGLVKIQTEDGSHMAVGHLTGSQLRCQQAQALAAEREVQPLSARCSISVPLPSL